MNRPTLITAAVSVPALTGTARTVAQDDADIPDSTYPIAWPGELPGDGFRIRHGYATENTWYNPGYWHTGED